MMALKILGITELKTQNIVTDSLSFIVLAFVIGHLIQFRSKEKTEKTIKNKYWSGSFVSNLFLVKGNRFCPEYDRQRYIQILQEHLGLKTADTQELENTDNDNAKIISQSMYRKCLTLIEDKNIGIKAINLWC